MSPKWLVAGAITNKQKYWPKCDTDHLLCVPRKNKKKIKTEALQTTARNATLDLIRLNLLTLELKEKPCFPRKCNFLIALLCF
jgi:hypothetical protein